MHPFHDSLPMLTQRMLASVMPPFRSLFAKHGITEQQWRILRILWEQEPLSQNEISRLSLIPKQSLVGIIDRMQALGLLHRHQSNEDRRKSEIRLTEKARSMKDEISREVEAVYAEIDQWLTPQQWQDLRSLLTQITERADP